MRSFLVAPFSRKKKAQFVKAWALLYTCGFLWWSFIFCNDDSGQGLDQGQVGVKKHEDLIPDVGVVGTEVTWKHPLYSADRMESWDRDFLMNL